ncbi:hypothetical protein chiPu_0016826 [Chiloscyllium punctatum]|uniref:Uncharacterized protein n=1 Tax=Chiloscyllium punctatum TaxID=137246 RepID=A0A401T6R7_CHIPU|nr:hypothetical protein [Chiloscyllium punctatum]
MMPKHCKERSRRTLPESRDQCTVFQNISDEFTGYTQKQTIIPVRGVKERDTADSEQKQSNSVEQLPISYVDTLRSEPMAGSVHELKSSLDSLTEKKSAVLQTELNQKQQISEVKEQASSLQTHITSEFTKMHQILTEKEQRLLRDLRKEEERVVKAMKESLRKIQENLNSIEEKLSKLHEQME